MTIEDPQAEQTPSTEPTGSIASIAAQLWDEVLQRLAKVQAVAPSSAQLWDEVLQRLTEVRETHAKLATAVDHLGALLSSALATERQRDLARRGIAADFALDVDVPPLLVVPASPQVEPSEPSEPSDEMPLLPEQTVTDTLRAPEEPETYESEAHEASYEGDHPWLTESVIVTPVNRYEIEEEGPWLAEPGVTEALEESSEAPAETAQALPEIAVLEIPEEVAFQTPELVDALLAAEFGDAAVMVMDPEITTLDAFLAEEFAPADQGNATTPEDLLPPTPADSPSGSFDTPFLTGSFDTPFLTGESTLPVEPPPIPAPLATADTAEIEDTLTNVDAADEAASETDFDSPSWSFEDTLTNVDAADEATEPEDLLPPTPADPPSWSFDTPFLAGESTLPVEPPPIPAPLATAETAEFQDTLTDVDAADETTEPEADSDPPSWSFDTPFLAGESTLPVERPPILAPLETADTAEFQDTLTDVDAADEATEPEDLLPPTPADSPSWSFDTPFLTGESTLPVEPPPIPAPLATANTAEFQDTLTDVDAAGEATEPEDLLPPTPADPPSWSFASMTTEILEAAPEESPREADALPADEVTRGSQDPLGPNVVSQDFTIVSKRRRHSHLHLR